MKYFKIFAFLLTSLLMAACSSNDDKPSYNTASGVTVSMAQDRIKFRESAGIVKVPVKVTGDANGYVTVVCEVKEYNEIPDGDPAMDDVHYMMTSKTLTIATGDTEGYFEIKTIDDFDINPSRYFTITLVSAEGATLGTPATTIVELKDNDQEPYDRLGGTWYIPCKDTSGGSQTLQIELEAYDDSSIGYGHAYLMKGLFDGESKIDIDFKYNASTEEGSLTLRVQGQNIFNYQGTPAQLYGVDDEINYLLTANLIFEWNEDFTELICTSNPEGYNLIAFWDGYLLDAAMKVTKFTRSAN